MSCRRQLVRAALLLLPACGPISPGEADGESGASSGPGDPTDSTGAPVPTTGDDPTTDGTSTATPTTADPTTADPTTADPVTCPKDQQPWVTVASNELPLPDGAGFSPFGGGQVGLPNGNFALAVSLGVTNPAPGVVIVSPLGEVLSVNAGAPNPVTFVSAIANDPAGGVVVLGQHDEPMNQRPFLARFAADGAPLGEASIAAKMRASTMALTGTSAITVGRTNGTGQWLLAQHDIVTGAPQWQAAIADEPGLILTRMTRDAQGDIFVAGADNPTEDGFTDLRIWRFTGAGQPVWNRTFVASGFDVVTDLELAPDGRVIALRIGPFPEFSVDLVAVDPADGALAWDLNVAVPDTTGRPSATDMHVDADALTIPIVRSEPGKFGRRTVDVHRVSYSGELVDLIPLADIPSSDDNFNALTSVRGACGELTLLLGFGRIWFASYGQ